MAAKLSSCFVSHGLAVFNSKHSNSRLNFPSNRLLPASCKMRQRNFSSQHRRQLPKKISTEQPQMDATLHPTDDEDAASESASTNDSSNSIQEAMNDNDTDIATKQVDEKSVYDLTKSDDSNLALPPSQHGDAAHPLREGNNTLHYDHPFPGDASGINVAPAHATESLPMNLVVGEEQSTIQLEDLISMIRNAEKNILLLNEARVHALEDLEKILKEKDTLRGEINILEMRLAESDAKIKVATQEKTHVNVLEDQLVRMRKELSHGASSEGSGHGVYGMHPEVPPIEVSHLHSGEFDSLHEELSLLKAENISLKDDIEVLRAELNSVKTTDERAEMLEKERSDLVSAVKDLESKLAASQEEVEKLSTLKSEYKGLWEKVDNLQSLLDNTTKQADQAILVLQQNQELRKKVDRLEESLEAANVYKISSEKLQRYNEFMHEKIKLLEEHLQRSDEEITSYIQLYQESIKEFQDTLTALKGESKKRSLDDPVDDMPWEFWSRLLLMIDGWLLEKKISPDDAKMLREKVWKREKTICDAYMACKEKNEREVLTAFLGLTSAPTRSGLHIIHIAAEMAPVAKVGGLGDVVTGLNKALQKKGHLVEIVIPKYDCIQYDQIHDLRVLDVTVESYFDGQLFKNRIWVGTVEGLPVYFIEPHHPSTFFWRGKYYGEHDDFKRFSFFSRAALELLLQAGKKPDIIHCHDWQTGFVAPLYWDLYAPKGLNSARICFTCHNFEYQGTAAAPDLGSCGLDVYQLNRPDRMQDHSAHDMVNPVKGAIVFSNIVTTVSPTYAQEVRTPEGGRGLHTTINSHSKKFVGILNGIDTDSWNPATDGFLEVQYNANDLHGKAANKEALRRQLGLSSADPKKPLVGCITRLVPQKGVHLIRHAIYRTMNLGGQFVLLGSSPADHIQREFEGLASHFQGNDNVRLLLKYDESLSHSIYAASDMFIIPSIFEPCGLTQMIAMRYGSIPIARKTGGLNDSVFDVDDEMIPLQFRNGYTFVNPDEQGVNNALDRALNHYKNRVSWEQLVQKVMRMDFSWDISAAQYEELYQRSVARAKAAKKQS